MQTWIRYSRQSLSLLLALAMLAVGPLVNSARAELVTTAALTPQVEAESARERVVALLARNEVRGQLESLGVDPAEAEARIASLSDREIAQLDTRIASLPAGQDFLALVTSILILTILGFFVTDLLGWTDVFPFVNEIPRGEAKSRNR